MSALADCDLNHVHIESVRGVAVFVVEIADDPQERARGLMFRESLARTDGMLFIFSDSAPRSFWMMNTLIPLDIIFFDENGQLVSIEENAEPQTLTPRESTGPAKYVLEIQGGLAARLGLGAGSQLSHPALGAENSHICGE